MVQGDRVIKIKIVILIDSLYSLSGGTENQLVKIVNSLDKSKFQLYLFVLRTTHWIEKNRDNLKCEVKTFDLDKLSNPLSILSFISLILTIRKVKPDVVMTFFQWANLIGVYAAKIAQVRNIISTRRDYGLRLQRDYLIFLRLANRYVKRIITNSQNVKIVTSEKENYRACDIHVIYNGINSFQTDKKLTLKQRQVIKQNIGIPLNHHVIGIIGGLKPMKRHFTFIKAAQKALQIRSDLSFVIIGDGIQRNSLEKLANSLGIERNIFFLGEREDILPYISIFDIGINCSSHEGLSNAIMEYMTYGVPCIVSDSGGNSELIKNGINGYTFRLDDIDELTDIIIQLLKSERDRKKFVSISQNIIRNEFSIDRMKNNYENFFINLIKN